MVILVTEPTFLLMDTSCLALLLIFVDNKIIHIIFLVELPVVSFGI